MCLWDNAPHVLDKASCFLNEVQLSEVNLTDGWRWRIKKEKARGRSSNKHVKEKSLINLKQFPSSTHTTTLTGLKGAGGKNYVQTNHIIKLNTLSKPIYLPLGGKLEKVSILTQLFLSISIVLLVIWIVVAVPALATSIRSASLPTHYGGIQALWVSGRETFPLTCQVTPECSAKLLNYYLFILSFLLDIQ